jgi:hypothetical protein
MMKTTGIPKQTEKPDQTAGFVLLATVLGALICGFFVFQADFPLNDGGMFYSMVQDLERNHFVLPTFITYNHSAIPFVYPPLAFYLTAFLNSFLRIDLLQLFRILPLFFTIASIPAFYFLTTQILARQGQQILATFLYAVSPAAYTWQIMGGGLTRSPAWFFSILGLFFFVKFIKTKKISHLIWIGLFTALTALTHLEMVWFLALTYLTVYLYFDRSWKSLFTLAITAVGVVTLISPWLVSVLWVHGLAPFRAAFSTGGFTLTSPIAFLLSMGGVDKMSLAFISLLAILGIFLQFRKKESFLFIWLLVLVFLDPRSSQRIAAIPIAMLAAVTLWAFFTWLDKNNEDLSETGSDQVILLKRPVAATLLGVLIYALFLNLYLFYGGISYLQTVNQENRQAMAWVRENTPADSRFVVLDFPYGWFSDSVAEWFPALTERQSLLTVQAQEWLPGAASKVSTQLSEATNCRMDGLSCFEKFATKDQLQMEYVYFSTNARSEYQPPEYSSVIEAQISTSPNYSLVYSNADVRIYQKLR